MLLYHGENPTDLCKYKINKEKSRDFVNFSNGMKQNRANCHRCLVRICWWKISYAILHLCLFVCVDFLSEFAMNVNKWWHCHMKVTHIQIEKKCEYLHCIIDFVQLTGPRYQLNHSYPQKPTAYYIAIKRNLHWCGIRSAESRLPRLSCEIAYATHYTNLTCKLTIRCA